MPHLCELYLGICLTTEQKAWKNLSQGRKNLSQGRKNLSQDKKNLSQGRKNLSQGRKNLSQDRKNLSQGRKNLSLGSCVCQNLILRIYRCPSNLVSWGISSLLLQVA